MITLINVGEVKGLVLSSLHSPLESVLGQDVQIGTGVPLPEKTCNKRRGQCHSTRILEYLPQRGPSRRVLGVADVDLYATGFDFVFGEAEFNGTRALISLTRLRQEFYGLPPDERLFQARVFKEAVHELGHTYRFRHCPNPVCVMHFSNSIADTDIKDWRFCPVCQRQLERRLSQ